MGGGFDIALGEKARKVQVDLTAQGWTINLQSIYRVLESALVQGVVFGELPQKA